MNITNLNEYKGQKIIKSINGINEKFDKLNTDAVLDHLYGKECNYEEVSYFVDNFKPEKTNPEFFEGLEFSEEDIAEMSQYLEDVPKSFRND